MKKGFTLVELLGVLILLALILTLVFPSVLNLITNSRGEVKSLTNKLVENAANLYIDSNKDKFDEQNGNSYCVTLSELVSEGYIKSPIVFSDTDEDQTELKSVQINYNNGYTYEIKDNGECVKYHPYRDKSGANVPDLMNGTLTPVVYDNNSKKWKIVDPSTEWYNYENQEWANAVILKSGVEKTVGKELNLPETNNDFESSDVLAMFVWIPRYSYTIKGTYGDGGASEKNPGAIDIKFVSKNTKESGSATYTDSIGNTWYTHPAFTFGSDELSGIWVGKFETTGNATTPTILPNQSSLRSQTVSEQFETAKKFNSSLKNADSHMMKNSEWGAVVYLTQSKYGKYGKDKSEVYINNCSNYITGIGANSVSESSSSETCTSDENRYNGTKGVNASTTGNIYGIYDMSGGAWERVMGVYTKASSSSIGFNPLPEPKYYDEYTSTSSTPACDGKACKGHALSETSGWYGDYAGFVSATSPWFFRGGYYGNTAYAGVFYSTCDDGTAFYIWSFRVVLASAT